MIAADSNRRPADVPTDDEIRALVTACSTRAPTGVRNRALIAVMWRCGLRIAEALALRAADVDLNAGTLRVAHGKGDKSRTVGVDTTTAALLARWIDRRKALGFNGRQRLFCTITTGHRKGITLAAGSEMESPTFGTFCAVWSTKRALTGASIRTACDTLTRLGSLVRARP